MTQRSALPTVVIGGGIIGLSLAYALSKRGHRVVVLEKNQGTCAQASRAAAGMLAPTSEAEIAHPSLLTLGFDSLNRYPQLIADLEQQTGLSIGYRQAGSLWMAFDQDQWAELEHLQARLHHASLGGVFRDRDWVLAHEPSISSRVLGALEINDDHHVNPRHLARALLLAVVSKGAEIRTKIDVKRITQTTPSTLRLHAERDGHAVTIDAAQVVMAAGAWLHTDLETPSAMLKRWSMRPVKGQVVRLLSDVPLHRVIRTPDVYLVPHADGELVIGATVEEQGFDQSPTAGAVVDLLRHAMRVVPSLYDCRFVECSVGLRPAVADHLPLIGATDIPNLFVASGHFRDGILLAPATAHYLADWMTTGEAPTALNPFALDREATSFQRLGANDVN